MDSVNLSHNKLLFYTTLQKFIKSFIGFTFFVFILLATISIGEAVLQTSQSLLFNNYLLDYDWIGGLLPAIVMVSVVYSTIIAPLDMITDQLILSDDGFTKTTGMLYKREITVPYACIDFVESKQSPLQKLFRLTMLTFNSDLMKKTGSGLLSTFQASEVTKEIAHRAALAHMYKGELHSIDAVSA